MRKSDDLKAEYLLIQGQYEAFDQRALSMKALATPLLGAGVAVAINDHSHAIILATILVATSLWLLESIWKGFQYCLTDRIIALESWFRGEGSDEMAPFQIYTAWGEVYRRERFKFVIMRMRAPFISLPYSIVIAICIASAPLI